MNSVHPSENDAIRLQMMIALNDQQVIIFSLPQILQHLVDQHAQSFSLEITPENNEATVTSTARLERMLRGITVIHAVMWMLKPLQGPA